MKRKGKLKPNQEKKPNLNLNYSMKDVELITGYPDVFEEQVNHPINKNVNEMRILLLRSQLFNKN